MVRKLLSYSVKMMTVCMEFTMLTGNFQGLTGPALNAYALPKRVQHRVRKGAALSAGPLSCPA